MVPIPTPGFPLLALINAPSGSHLLSLSKNKTGLPLLLEGSRLRYWLCPSLKRPQFGRASKPLPLSSVVGCAPYEFHTSTCA
jgi:hypothetical protein